MKKLFMILLAIPLMIAAQWEMDFDEDFAANAATDTHFTCLLYTSDAADE